MRTNRRIFTLVRLIIGINIAVFVAWLYSGSGEIDRDLMTNYFLISFEALQEGRYLALLGSAFSHNMLLHVALNLFVLNSFGPIVEMTLGARRFLGFYLVASVVSSLSHALVSNYILQEPNLPALGASGAIAGLILLFSLLFPKQKILILGIIPVPAFFGALLFIGLDLWGLSAQAKGGGLPIGHGAHLGGAAAGLVYGIWLRAEASRREKLDDLKS